MRSPTEKRAEPERPHQSAWRLPASPCAGKPRRNRTVKHYAPHLRENARILRKNMTKQERKLWYDFLKHLPVTVKRQELIGRYIADFYIPSAHLAIELDGSQHFEKQGLAYDRSRDLFFTEQGIDVLRYPNNEIICNFPGVCEDILQQIKQRTEISERTE